MKVAVIGSRTATAAAAKLILRYLPSETTEIVSGGAQGIDSLAEEIATALSLPIRVFRPDYTTFGRQAPLVRNRQIVEYADMVLAFWDGNSRGTQHAITTCLQNNTPVRIIPLSEKEK